MSRSAQPLVSVVLPTHDRPDRLAAALASVVTQQYDHLEVVVVDDASSTPARDVVERIAVDDARVRLLELPERCGAAAARNAALDRCSGGLVAFLDDDDQWDPDKIRLQVKYLEDHPEVGLVTCDYTVVDESTPGATAIYRGPASFTAEQVQWMNFPGGFSFVMVRRALVGAALSLDVAFSSVEDWDLWLRCLRHAPAGVVPTPLVHHVAHAGPRLSHPESERSGHELFLRKHGGAMSPVCRSYLGAHLRMYEGSGWSHRAAVARSVLTGSPRVSAILAVEQAARQLGRVARDPGLVARTLAHLIGPDGQAGTVPHLASVRSPEAYLAEVGKGPPGRGGHTDRGVHAVGA